MRSEYYRAYVSLFQQIANDENPVIYAQRATYREFIRSKEYYVDIVFDGIRYVVFQDMYGHIDYPLDFHELEKMAGIIARGQFDEFSVLLK